MVTWLCGWLSFSNAADEIQTHFCSTIEIALTKLRLLLLLNAWNELRKIALNAIVR